MSLKERLGAKLTPAQRLTLRRFYVHAVEGVAGLARHVRGVPARPPQAEAFGASDFNSLLDELRGRAPRPDPGRPVRASVVLLCRGGVNQTFRCLRSLLREVDFKDAEVVVVNDPSSDSTAELLSNFGGYVRVVNPEAGAGLDAGAAAARGKYLVFLDQNVVVGPDWLSALAETADGDERAGAVGSMLLRVDGRIREAGGVVWRDAGVIPYGRGQSPDDRRFNFAREVDYCSGASLLVRKDLFDRLGGFDQDLAPGGYQDVDLCFGLRALGYKVVYQPLSRVVYDGDDFNQPQSSDRAKFIVKWREALEREQHAPDLRRLERAASRAPGPSVFVFDDCVPTPDRDAGSARMLFILRALREWSRPVFVALSKQPSPDYERLLWKEGVETAHVLDYRRLLREREFYAAVLSRPGVAETLLKLLRRAEPRLKIVYDMVDAHFVRLGRESELTGDAGAAREADRFRELETRLIRSADLVWYASEADREAVERLVPSVPSAVIPTIHPLRGPGRPFGEREHFIFIGNFRHRPNADAVRFFVGEILPHLRAEVPGARLLVVGDNAPPDVRALASEEVRLLGYVPDLDALMEGARVFVAPIRFGAGVNGKIGEALAYGLPVVTTSVGAAGMRFADGEQALVADSPREFAAAAARLYRDAELWQELSARGRRHVAQHFTPEVVRRLINDSLRPQ